jgi:hypothetical protein
MGRESKTARLKQDTVKSIESDEKKGQLVFRQVQGRLAEDRGAETVTCQSMYNPVYIADWRSARTHVPLYQPGF